MISLDPKEEKMKDLQDRVNKIRSKRGFTMDPLKIFTLLNEEIGEVATELKKGWSPNYDGLNIEKLKEELADVQVCLCALANQYGINLEEAVEEKFVKKDSKRTWKTMEGKNL